MCVMHISAYRGHLHDSFVASAKYIPHMSDIVRLSTDHMVKTHLWNGVVIYVSPTVSTMGMGIVGFAPVGARHRIPDTTLCIPTLSMMVEHKPAKVV